MDDDLTVLIARMRLALHAHPAVALIGALKITRRYRVREGKKSSAVSARWPQPLQIEAVLVIEHALEPFARHIAFTASVDGVANRHVVGRNGFRYGPRRRAHLEEPARDFLTRANL